MAWETGRYLAPVDRVLPLPSPPTRPPMEALDFQKTAEPALSLAVSACGPHLEPQPS